MEKGRGERNGGREREKEEEIGEREMEGEEGRREGVE